MAETIQTADLLPCESNKYMHSAPLAEDVRRFLSDIENFPPARDTRSEPGTSRPPGRALDLQEPGVP
jgi:hypothetical protein